MSNRGQLTKPEATDLIGVLKARFEANPRRHADVDWASARASIEAQPDKLHSLSLMEATGGEPDVVGVDNDGGYRFVDCSAQSPLGRRSLCYDGVALASRKKNKPRGSAIEMAATMGIAMLTEEDYRDLQQRSGPFDTKTSSWVITPQGIRAFGGAIFCDYRFGRAFVYHNGADSYYAARGFRGSLVV
jgi:hypothetical protein